MKMKSLYLAICGLFVFALMACAGDNVAVKYSDMPQPVQQFVGMYFASDQVQSIRADKDDAIVDYNIVFANGTKLEIDAQGNWEDVSNYSEGITTAMLPDSTQTYIAANYPNIKVLKAEKDRKGYEVKLANGLELKFDLQGVFLRIDR